MKVDRAVAGSLTAMQGLLILGAASAGVVVVTAWEPWERMASDLTNNTIRDMSRGSLQALAAQARMEGGAATQLVLLVQTAGTTHAVDLNDTVLILRSDQGRISMKQDEVQRVVLRDRDGSLRHGVMNRADLVVFVVPLAEPLRIRSAETAALVLYPPEVAEVRMVLTWPRPAGDGWVELDVEHRL